jgi:ferredoxin-NADP reductase
VGGTRLPYAPSYFLDLANLSLFNGGFAKLAWKIGAVLEYVCRVTSTKNLTPSVFELTFTPEKPFAFEAGQYVSVVVPHPDKPLRRPYSIASAPGKIPVELCIQRIESGPGNSYLASLKTGDTFTCFAPYGFLVFHPKPNRDMYFISTGTGIAPFRSMILSEKYRDTPPRKAICLLGVKTESELLYAEELRQIPGLEWVSCISRMPQLTAPGWKGRVTEYLTQNEKQILWNESDFYLCGNGAMIDEVKKILKQRGVAKESIHQEIYFKPPASGVGRDGA